MCKGECKKDDINEIIQNSMFDISRDIVKDYQQEIKKRDIQHFIIVLVLILSLVGSFFYYTYKLSEFDYSDVDRIITTTDNNSQIDNSKDINAQNNINVTIPKKDN